MSWKTWSPFQSDELKSIGEHLTKAECLVAFVRGILGGLWCAVCLAPAALALKSPSVAMLLLAAAVLIVFGACIPLLQRSQRRFFASTEWAKKQGLSAESLRLFSFSRHRRTDNTRSELNVGRDIAVTEHAMSMRVKLVLGVLVATNALTMLALGYARLEIWQWENVVMKYMTVPYAMLWAKEDFQKDQRQLFVCEWLQDEPSEMIIEGDIEQFEIITWPSVPLEGRPARKVWEVVLHVYNNNMKRYIKQSKGVPDNEEH